jgi:cardiolipin-specific phospholipase
VCIIILRRLEFCCFDSVSSPIIITHRIEQSNIRLKNNIDKMILSGHSFGGYVAVAYCERYPEHVDQLILLSPLGVPDGQDPNVQRRMERMRSSLRRQVVIGIFQTMFDWTTPGGVIRSFTEHRGNAMSRDYVERRLPEITDVDESEALADFLYLNAALPPSGEYFLNTLLTSTMLAKKPILFRVPSLKVKSVNFMYGSTDWMDISGGMYTEALCHRLLQQQDGSSLTPSAVSVPDVNVFLVPDAGHLLMLQNPKIVNAGIISIAGGKVRDEEMPALMDLDEAEKLNESWLSRAREISEENLIS